uniref:Transcription factor IIIC 90kDa subunit N-terminal domain-containing protein n=1 Tax=Cucumis melo TaxID=3656 RepID=A0A9I9D034_CUCME
MVETFFQAVSLVAAPNYPNAIAWSDENLIALASGPLVTIVNPASPFGARGTITIPATDPLRIGLVERKDLFSDCLLTTCLSRDDQPRAQSVAWSPIGMAPNAGCLLAVCTSEGCVKLYRPPFCDFSAEWIEYCWKQKVTCFTNTIGKQGSRELNSIVDISNKLYDYLESIKYGELDVLSSKSSDIPAKESGSAVDVQENFTKKNSKRRKKDELKSENLMFNSYSNESSLNQSLEKSKEKRLRRRSEDSSVPPLISAQQYASRSAMLLSLVIAWSPVIKPSDKAHLHQNSSACVLAVGTKSGKVSFWKVNVPECYSLAECMVPTSALLVGILQAHNSWINCISWMLFDSDSSSSKVLVATGSTDGSVKIWQCSCEELLASSDSNFASFSLLKEVISGEGVPTVLSLNMPNLSEHKLFLAIGRGSGSLEIRIFNLSNSEFDNVLLYDAHYHVVTGVAWAVDGRYLFTCSEDNTLRGWSLDESSLREVPISSHIPELGGSIDLPDTFRSCFGIAMSPGNLVGAVVRNFDLESLDKMYQARTQKAAVQFFWIGGEEIEVMPNSSYFYTENFSNMSKKEFVRWESSMLWSLNQLKNLNKPMVVWEVVAALLAFRHSIPEYVDHILLKWLATSYLHWSNELSATKILSHISKNVSTFSTRQLHLLNIICRRVVLSESVQDQVNDELQNLDLLSSERLDDTENEKHILWKKLLLSSERELRQRLIVNIRQWSSALTVQHRFHWSLQNLEFARAISAISVCPATAPLWFCMCCCRSAFRLAPDILFQMSETPNFHSLKLSDSEIPSKPLCPFCGILLQRRQPDFLLSACPV